MQEVAECRVGAVGDGFQPGIDALALNRCQADRQSSNAAHPALPSLVVNRPAWKAISSSRRPLSEPSSFFT